MYKITRRGKEEPFFVDNAVGEPLFRRWSQNETLPARLVIGNVAFSSADIKAIEKVPETNAEKAPTHGQSELEYLNWRKKMLAVPAEKRCGYMRIPEMIWRSHTNEPMTEEIQKEIQALQLAYFKEHPGCIYASPKVYWHLIPPFRQEMGLENMTRARNIIPTSVLRLIQNLIHTDLMYAEQAAAQK